MRHIDDTIAKIPKMTPKERSEWRKRAERVLAREPTNVEAAKVTAALDATEVAPPSAEMLEVTGALAWEKYRAGITKFRAFRDGRVVGDIFMRDHHTADNKDVYVVTILGKELPGVYQRIDDARRAGEAEFVAQTSRERTE